MSNNSYAAERQDNVIVPISDDSARNRLEKFYRTAFLPLRKEVDEGYQCYRVFVGRRCLVTAHRYVLQNRNRISQKVLGTLYSDGSLRVVAEKMGKAYHQYLLQHPDGEIDDFKHIIILFDDILIHGRALGGLLSEAEDIFADTFLSVSKNSCRRREELYDVFLKRIVIRTAFRNSNPSLLRLRYKSRIIPEDNLYEPSEWRWFGYEIAESVYQAEVPNAAFVPAVLLDGRYMRGRIKKTFLKNAERKGVRQFSCLEKGYLGRDIDAYICLLKDKAGLSAVMTLRCTENYLIPFVFLPRMDLFQYLELCDRIDTLLVRISPRLQRAVLRKSEEWNENRLNRSALLSELLNALLSSLLLRAFLAEIGLPGGNTGEDFVRQHTTVPLVLWNFAYDDDIRELLYTVMDPEVPPVCSLSELQSLLSDFCRRNNSRIFTEISDITERGADGAAMEKALRKIEKVVFDYAISSESRANSLLMGSLSPSERSVRYFSFPSDNTVGDFLHKVYAYRDSWIRRSLPLTDVFFYLLQMMDAGFVSLRVGEDREKPGVPGYIQCIKPGEQSLNTLPYTYAYSLPLLAEIERRCKRQNAVTIYGLNDELTRFFAFYKNYEKRTGADLSFFDQFIPQKNRLLYLLHKIISSGQSCNDYMFLVEKKLRDNGINQNASELIATIRKIFYRVSY